MLLITSHGLTTESRFLRWEMEQIYIIYSMKFHKSLKKTDAEIQKMTFSAYGEEAIGKRFMDWKEILEVNLTTSVAQSALDKQNYQQDEQERNTGTR